MFFKSKGWEIGIVLFQWGNTATKRKNIKETLMTRERKRNARRKRKGRRGEEKAIKTLFVHD